ncbi:MAG: ArsR family transcriptional regulator, zinc-responsive transcriptional repressor [Actinomycetota bacterium]|jgi:DNA-binding transcriptional ArsR family regulator|nr:ArsR family transcriptional regulator, zinc-responsive transcriptional repressor [Actinomycetota bacterium]
MPNHDPPLADATHVEPALAPLPRVRLADYEPASDLLRALSAPLRLAIIDLLSDAPRCVHELVDALGSSQTLVSQHLKTLRAARLVTTHRRGREVVYELVDDHVAHVARDTLRHSREERDGSDPERR